MGYFNYHAITRRLILDGKLIGYKFVEKYKAISPCLLLFFADTVHPVMPIREYRFLEYLSILPSDKEIFD